MHYMNKNYVLKPIYNNENECTNDTLSPIFGESDRVRDFLNFLYCGASRRRYMSGVAE